MKKISNFYKKDYAYPTVRDNFYLITTNNEVIGKYIHIPKYIILHLGEINF